MNWRDLRGSVDGRYRQRRRRRSLAVSSSWERRLASLRCGETRHEKKNEKFGLPASKLDCLIFERVRYFVTV